MQKSNPGAAACLAIFAQTLSETERQKLRENCELLFRLLGEGAAEGATEGDDNEAAETLILAGRYLELLEQKKSKYW